MNSKKLEKKDVEKAIKEKWRILEFCNGFEQPKRNYFWVPKQLDYLMSILSGDELKTLLYIIRHTWGYNKTDDIISYPQFMTGITSRQGDIVDYGTGLSRMRQYKALKRLKEYGLIEVEKRKGKANSYRLRYKKPVSSLIQGSIAGDTTPVSTGYTHNSRRPIVNIQYERKYKNEPFDDVERQIRKAREEYDELYVQH